MKKHRIPVWLLLSVGYIFLLAGGSLSPAVAQSSGLTVRIGRPAEGETFYSGPSSLQYNIVINGWAFSDQYPSTDLKIRLELIQGEALLSSQVTQPGPDGSFLFNAMVNPGNSQQVFPAEHAGCADTCHFAVEPALPDGVALLRVTATDPAGGQAVAERRITVDRSTILEVPVQLALDSEASYILQEVQVTASTRLYLWRSRHALAAANGEGMAFVPLEVLSEAPTTYIFNVEPQLVGGVLFRGVEPVTLSLPPGAVQAPAITLHVRAQAGRIDGQLAVQQAASLPRLPVLACHLPEGECQQMLATSQGEFSFESLPIGRYLITLDEGGLAEQGYLAQAALVDLADDPEAALTLDLSLRAGRVISGRVSQADGSPVPFAWVEASNADQVVAVLPDSGQFRLDRPEPGAASLLASAPGYYSRALIAPPDPDQELVVSLVRRPETRSIPWGDGEILVPSEAKASQEDRVLILEHGWLWGDGGDSTPVTLRAAGTTIRVADGRFALEAVPGRPAWFYLFEGRAELQATDDAAPIPVQAGQMVRLEAGAASKPVAYQPALVAGLAAQQAASGIPLTWQPSLQALLRDLLARLGIGAAQIITLTTYLLVLAALVVGPLLALRHIVKQRRGL